MTARKERNRLLSRLREFHTREPARGIAEIAARLPGETDTEFEARIETLPQEFRDAARLLRELDGLMPLERDPETDVFDTLHLYPYHLRDDWNRKVIVARNAMGLRELVKVFLIHPDGDVENWSSCIEESRPGDSPWDEARRERRTAPTSDPLYGGCRHYMIERGVNLALDRLTAAGCRTLYSCEGHPDRAYLYFSGDDESLAACDLEFRRLGWKIEHCVDTIIARMPKADSVETRDELWREFSYGFNPQTAPKGEPKP